MRLLSQYSCEDGSLYGSASEEEEDDEQDSIDGTDWEDIDWEEDDGWEDNDWEEDDDFEEDIDNNVPGAW